MLEDTLEQQKSESYLIAYTVDVGRLRQIKKFADGQSSPTCLLTT